MIGKVINGRYKLLDKIGQGGMATVYRASDLNLGREVAVKVLQESIANDPDFRERFRREARAASVLNNPHIVQVYDFIESEEGTFIVMELVRGEDLRSLLKRSGRLSLDRSINIILDVLSALQDAHQHGLVHRDVSARNVLIGEHGEVKVSDFGIARVLGERTLTQTGELIGSVEYISPEQANGEEADCRSDIYSVGVLLYQLLTGVLPFTASNAVKLAVKHIQEIPSPPSSLRPEISSALDDIVLCAMEKDPADRFESALAMSEALDSLRYAPEDEYSSVDEYSDDEFATLVRPVYSGDSEVYGEDSGEFIADSSIEEHYGDAKPRKKRGRALLLMALLLIVFAAIVGGVTWKLVYSVPRTVVANVEGERLDAAIATLEQLGFRTNIQEQRAVEGVPEGVVVEQDPKAGTELAQGSVVYLVVSRSKDAIFLPSFIGVPLDTALKELKRLGIQANILHIDDTAVPPNTIVEQDPAAGTKVARGSFVTLKVSDKASSTEAPKLVGMSVEEAMKAIARLGMIAVVKETEDSGGSPGTVLRQDPAPGTAIERGSRIVIVVLKAKTSTTVMPNLVGKTVNAALAEAKALGLELIVEGGGSGNSKISKQRPAAGVIVEDGKAYVSSFNMAVVPSLNGLNYDTAVEKLREAGLILGNVTTSYEDNVPGIVVQQYPSGGIETDYGAAVDLTITDSRPAAAEPAPEPAPALEPELPADLPHPQTPASQADDNNHNEVPPPPAPALPSSGEGTPPTPALDLPGDLPI